MPSPLQQRWLLVPSAQSQLPVPLECEARQVISYLPIVHHFTPALLTLAADPCDSLLLQMCLRVYAASPLTETLHETAEPSKPLCCRRRS